MRLSLFGVNVCAVCADGIKRGFVSTRKIHGGGANPTSSTECETSVYHSSVAVVADSLHLWFAFSGRRFWLYSSHFSQHSAMPVVGIGAHNLSSTIMI